MPCETIDEVIAQLDQIIQTCKASNNPLGYFAVLYQKVTKRVKQGIANNEFDDNPLMEKLDVVFANRYIEAYHAWQQKQMPSKSWQVAFVASEESGHVILQHLLLGINAHINFDLGIATIDCLQGKPLAEIQQNFFQINALLASMVDEVKSNMSKISPIFKYLMPLAKSMDEQIINFSISTARDGAWGFANQLALNSSRQQLLNQRDDIIYQLGYGLKNPGRRLSWILKIVNLFEWRDIKKNMEILAE